MDDREMSANHQPPPLMSNSARAVAPEASDCTTQHCTAVIWGCVRGLESRIGTHTLWNTTRLHRRHLGLRRS